MRHGSLFDELIEFQKDTNRFFEDVYKRLAMFEVAMNRWNSLEGPVEAEFSAERRVEGGSGVPLTSGRIQQEHPVESTHRGAISSQRRGTLPTQTTRQAALGRGYGSRSAIESTNRQALPSAQNDVVDVRDDYDWVVARVALPGIQEGDIDISVYGNKLYIQGKVTKTISLPNGVEASGVRAYYQNGILEVRLPKSQTSRKVDVNFKY